MIYSNLTVTISGGESRVNEKIILYRGDRDIQVSFEIVQASFRFGKGENVINTRKAGYGQLIIDKPDDTYTFSEMTPCDDGLVVFTITSDMIDELTEVGLYSMQIRLFDETGQSRITLPPINDAIEVREPIATEDISEIGEVGVATVGYAVLNGGEETEDIFDDDGEYKIMYWNTGDIITEGRLNRTEDAIYETNSKVENIVIPDTSDFITESEVDAKGYLTEHQSLTDYATKAEIPTNISQLTNDSGYLTEHQSLTDYATKSYVDEAINALRTELMALINSGGNNSSEVWAHADDDYTNATTNNDITKVYVELTSSNYTTRPKEVLQYYPNCEELYLFDDGTVVTLENIFSAGDILEVDTVEFMDGYFGNATSLQNSFKNQTYIKVVKNLPNSVTNMNACFYGCTALRQVPTLPSNLTNMTSTFFNCTSLIQAPDIPSKVTTMAYCFRGCSNLATPPTIYTDVITNMSSSFHDCSALTAVTIPLRITSYGNCLNGCSALVDITWSGERTTNFILGTDGLRAPSYTQADIQELVTGHLANLGGSSATLTLGETYLAYLTEEEKAAAVAKGWTLV